MVTLVAAIAALLVGRAYRNECTARLAEQLAKMQAQDNFRTANSAISDLVELSGTQLAYFPGSEGVPKPLADKSLAYCREMLRSQPHDPGVRFGTARILRVAANIDRMTGLYEEALPLYREATVLLTALAGELPTVLPIHEIHVEMAFNAIDTGEHLRMNGQPAASKSYFQNVARRPGRRRPSTIGIDFPKPIEGDGALEPGKCDERNRPLRPCEGERGTGDRAPAS